MKAFILKVWWKSTATRILFPMGFLAVGIPLVAIVGGEGIIANIGMGFIMVAVITFVIGFSYEIHKSAGDVDKAIKEKEKYGSKRA